MLSLEVRKKAGGAEVHRVPNGAVTVGASSGNEVVVRARGVAGRHLRIFEKDGRYQLDLFKGVDAVTVNGREFAGGTIAAGDRIAIGEATITVINIQPGTRQTPVHETPIAQAPAAAAAPAPSIAPTTEVEYRALRLAVYRLCREHALPEELATAFVDFFDREFAATEWAVGELGPATGFRALASTFLEHPAIPPHLLDEVRAGERIVRSESVTGVLTLIVEPREGDSAFAVLVRETPRLAARAVLFLEEAVQAGGIAVRAPSRAEAAPAREPVAQVDPATTGPIETILRQTDDLKKIVETVEREVIERAMRRVEGNQSRGAEVLNISRGSLIAKLKEFGVPDFRYLRRERQKRS
ncbi:MAG TPA: helix-turn-helix domain-containing protein [Thermoanaerobaculia bacterium]|nr:helix-turn-helix domain-containing protein [Thermoanaerobaculia bacterium]